MPHYENSVWVFVSSGAKFPGGVFTTFDKAEAWVVQHMLTGVLTRYPVDEGVFQWALHNDCVGMKPEKLSQKLSEPGFVGSFTTASMEHYHYEAGER